MKTGIFTMKRVLAFTIAVVASMTMLAGGTQPVMTAQNASAESQAIKNNKKKISSAKDKISELEQKQADLDKADKQHKGRYLQGGRKSEKLSKSR